MSPTRSRTRVALSRERILRAALDILDREGLEAISMRRVGEALGVEAMSLYNHVPSKAAILDGLYEAVLDELPVAKRTSSWQAALKERGRALRRVLQGHPNALAIFVTRPAVTSDSLAHVEAALEVLRTAGFSADDALSALQVLVAFVIGHSMASYAPRRAEEAAKPDYDRLSAESFPRVREAARVLTEHDVDKEFALGLEAMVTGLEKRAKPARARP